MIKTYLEHIKMLYDEGFKCIKYEQDTEDAEKLTIYLKNFESEKIHTFFCSDEVEIKKIREYIDFN